MSKRKFAETLTNVVCIGDIDLGEFPLLLAPMEDVSDPPFRALCKEYGADMMYTEFISSEGLIRDAAKSVTKLDIFDYEKPIGIQIFGSEICNSFNQNPKIRIFFRNFLTERKVVVSEAR